MSKRLAMLSASLLLSLLCGCREWVDLLRNSGRSESDRLSAQIEAEEKQLELEKIRAEIRRLQTPSPTPRPRVTPQPANQSPRIEALEGILAATAGPDDTVKLQVRASDPDGDLLEYNWSSVLPGLSANKGEAVSWMPTTPVNGQTNVITVSVSDKRGGSSSASLNIYSRADGTLLVREDLANKPIITALQATRTRDGRVFLRASARDPGGSLLRYTWSASAGSLSVNAAATTLWSGPEQVGSVTIRLSVSNAAGLQSDETLRFERQADGALLGNFSGADLIVGADGALLPEPALKINTPLLFVRNDQLWRYQTQTRELKQLFSLAELTPPVGVAQQQLNRLIRDPEGQQVHLIYVQNFLSSQRQLGWISVDLATGEARQVDTARKTTLPGELSFNPDENQLLFVRQGKRYAISSLQGADGGYWLTDFSVSTRYRKLPENFAPIAVSPQGVVLGFDTAQPDQLQAWDSETEQLTDVLKPSALNFNPSVFNNHQLAWDPTGRQFALLSQQWVARENQVELQVCTLAGECRRRWRTVGLRQYRQPEWSPDGRFLSVFEVPLNSTAPAATLKVYDLEQPEQFLDTGETFTIGQYWDTVWGS